MTRAGPLISHKDPKNSRVGHEAQLDELEARGLTSTRRGLERRACGRVHQEELLGRRVRVHHGVEALDKVPRRVPHRQEREPLHEMRAHGPGEGLEAGVGGRDGEVRRGREGEGRAHERGVALAPRHSQLVGLGDAVDDVRVEPRALHRHGLAAVQEAHPVPEARAVGPGLRLGVPAKYQ